MFPLLVPPSFVARMRPGDSNDPLLRQVLPLRPSWPRCPAQNRCRWATTTAVVLQGYCTNIRPGIDDLDGACAIHCRYCFRRHYPYGDEPRQLDEWAPALSVLANDTTIRVLLSGGDPLMLTDTRLGDLIERLDSIPHLQAIANPFSSADRPAGPVTRRLIGLLQSTNPADRLFTQIIRTRSWKIAKMLRTLVRAGITT